MEEGVRRGGGGGGGGGIDGQGGAFSVSQAKESEKRGKAIVPFVLFTKGVKTKNEITNRIKRKEKEVIKKREEEMISHEMGE